MAFELDVYLAVAVSVMPGEIIVVVGVVALQQSVGRAAIFLHLNCFSDHSSLGIANSLIRLLRLRLA